MALSEPEFPQWPRPRRKRTEQSLHVYSSFEGEREEDRILHQDLRQHPLGQRPEAHSLFPVILLLLFFCVSSVWSWTQAETFELSATQRTVFQQGEIWRLITTLGVHADIAHLLANSGLFLIFGLFLRNYFGLWAFPGLSMMGGVLTGTLALLTYGPDVRLIGASGMVYFMAALWLVLFFRYADYLNWGHRLMRAIAFSLVVLVPTQFEPQVSYRTHAIGFGLGLFFGWLSSPWLKPLTSGQRHDEEERDQPRTAAELEEDLLP